MITWEDCVTIEQARVGALRARGFTDGIPRKQIYGPHAAGEMGA